MAAKTIKDWMGKEVLFRVISPGTEHDLYEGKVTQISPSGRCVQIGYGWHFVDKIEIIEEQPPDVTPPDFAKTTSLAQRQLDAAAQAEGEIKAEGSGQAPPAAGGESVGGGTPGPAAG